VRLFRRNFGAASGAEKVDTSYALECLDWLDFLPELIGNLPQLVFAQRSDIGGILNRIEQRRGEGGPHRTSYPTLAR
jgi:hypothetical protein